MSKEGCYVCLKKNVECVNRGLTEAPRVQILKALAMSTYFILMTGNSSQTVLNLRLN